MVYFLKDECRILLHQNLNDIDYVTANVYWFDFVGQPIIQLPLRVMQLIK